MGRIAYLVYYITNYKFVQNPKNRSDQVSEDLGVHFSYQDTYYMLQSDEYLYKFTGHIDDVLMFERDDLETNPCMTGFDQFINSIKLK